MAVRIRMKKMGRTHAPFYRICAMDKRSPRDGRVIENLGTYDPMCPETDARATLKTDRIDYWLSVGAQPSDKVAVLIKKYGTDGSHLEARDAALERLGKRKEYTPAPFVPPKPKKEEPKAEEAPASEAANAEATNADATDTEAPAADAPAAGGEAAAADDSPKPEASPEASAE